jgi:hypothetical protein
MSRFLEPEEVRSTFELGAPTTPTQDDEIIDISGVASVDTFLAELWSE